MLLADALNDHGWLAQGTGVGALAEVSCGFRRGLSAEVEMGGGGLAVSTVIGGRNGVGLFVDRLFACGRVYGVFLQGGV